MSDKNITVLFGSQSPKIQLSPLKRSNSPNCDEILTNSKKQICHQSSKIVVQDTPTPFMSRKIKSRIAEEDNVEKKTFRSGIKIAKRIVPNTPVQIVKVNQSINSKKVKKLFDNNLLLLEEELPGNEDRIKLKDNGKKVSSLFKPRFTTEDNKFFQSETSIDNLEKKPKKRNPLVARLSDIELTMNNKNDKTQIFDQESAPPSPIIVSTKTNTKNSNNVERSQLNDSKSVNDVRTSIAYKLTTLNYTQSFTNISEITCQNQSAQDKQNFEERNLETESYSQSIDENKIDQILFDGLKITDQSENKSNNKAINEKKMGLFDKTNTVKMLQKSKYDKDNLRPKSKDLFMDVIYPNKAKTLNIFHLSLSENQTTKMKQIVKYMNSESKKNPLLPNAIFHNTLKSNTSHLVIDFETLSNNSLKTIQQVTLILAIMKCCKIMRYEWLIHSELKRKWCLEDQYTLESYIDVDLNDLDEEQNEFDIRLFKFGHNLKLTDRVDLFSKCGNIYLISCENENMKDVSLSDSFFKYTNKLNDYFHELITKCNGLITSRAACADLIILIDTSNDYETMTKYGAELVRQDAIKFKKLFKEIKDKLIKFKIKKKINIISSNWVIESVLDNYYKNMDDYVICCYEGFN